MSKVKNLIPDEPYEGAPCPHEDGGFLVFAPVENCSCHISPPCGACTENKLMCNVCHEEFD